MAPSAILPPSWAAPSTRIRLPSGRGHPIPSFGLAEMEIIIAPLHAVHALGIGLRRIPERFFPGNIISAHQHNDGPVKGPGQVPVRKRHVLDTVGIAYTFIRHGEPARIGAHNGVSTRMAGKEGITVHELAAGGMTEKDDLAFGMGPPSYRSCHMVDGIKASIAAGLNRPFFTFCIGNISFLIPPGAGIFLLSRARVDGAAGPLALGAKGSVRDRLTPPGRVEGFRPREVYSTCAGEVRRPFGRTLLVGCRLFWRRKNHTTALRARKCIPLWWLAPPPCPVGSMSLDSRVAYGSPMNPVPLPPPQFGGAAKGKRLNGQARRLTSPHLEVLCRTSTGDYKAPFTVEPFMKECFSRCFILPPLAGEVRRSRIGGGERRSEPISRMLIMPYDTESKSRNADFISIARRGQSTTLWRRPSLNTPTASPTSAMIMKMQKPWASSVQRTCRTW